MKSAVETLNPTRVKLTVEVPYEELKPSLDAAYKTISSQVTVPGFRKGHVPPRIIDQRFGRGVVLEEAVSNALPTFYAQAVEESDVRPLGQPQVEVNELPEGTSGELKFTAEVDVRPTLDLPDLDGLEIEVDDVEVTDEDVDAQVANLRERFGSLVTRERAAGDGDFVTIDLAASIDGEEIDSVKNVSYQVGSGNMLAGMDEALTGLSAGETTTFDSELVGGDRAGQLAHVTLTLQAVKERELPELDDDFAQLASEFDSLEELREDLRRQALTGKRMEQVLQARERLQDKLLASVEVPVPDGVIEQEVHQHLEGENRLEDEEHRGEVTEQARQALASQLLLDAIAERVEVSVSQQELIEYIVTNAQQYGMDPGAFAQALEKAGQIPAVVGEVARRKALMSVLTKAKVTDSSGNVVDVEGLLSEMVAAAAAAQTADEDDLDDDLEYEDDDEVADEDVVVTGAVAQAADPTALPVSDLGGFEPAEPVAMPSQPQSPGSAATQG